jgi:hypothetical protein
MDDPASSFLMFFAAEAGAAVESASFVSTALNLLLVVFLVLANGFFVASEFSLVRSENRASRRSPPKATKPRRASAGYAQQSQRLYFRHTTRHNFGFIGFRLGR